MYIKISMDLSMHEYLNEYVHTNVRISSAIVAAKCYKSEKFCIALN